MNKLANLLVAVSITTVLAACSGNVDSETPNTAPADDTRPLSALKQAEAQKLCSEDTPALGADLGRFVCMLGAGMVPAAECQTSFDACFKDFSKTASCSDAQLPDLSKCPQMPTIAEYRTCMKAFGKAAHEALGTLSCTNPPKIDLSTSASPDTAAALPECKKIQEGCPSVLSNGSTSK